MKFEDESEVGMEFFHSRDDLVLLAHGLYLFRQSPSVLGIPLHPDEYARLCQLRQELLQAVRDIGDPDIPMDDDIPPEEKN